MHLTSMTLDFSDWLSDLRGLRIDPSHLQLYTILKAAMSTTNPTKNIEL